MATKKTPEHDPNWLKNQLDAIHEHYRPIQRRYSICEYTPAYEDDCKWYPEQYRIVSPYFDSDADAALWMADYDPSPGTQFKVQIETLCEHTERTWMYGDWFNA